MRRHWGILVAAVLVVALVVRLQHRNTESSPVVLTAHSLCSIDRISPGDFYNELLPTRDRPVSSEERDGAWTVNNWGGTEKVWFKRRGGPDDWMVRRVVGYELVCDGQVVVKKGDDWDLVGKRFQGLVSPSERCFYLDSDKPGIRIGIAVTVSGRFVDKVSLEEVAIEK